MHEAPGASHTIAEHYRNFTVNGSDGAAATAAGHDADAEQAGGDQQVR